jgi:hypothetical protein
MSAIANSHGEQLLEDLEKYFRGYAVLAPSLPLILGLWAVATHLFESFDCFPYLAITSPTKRCGKTRTGELLEFVCASPLRTVGISVAALFRVIQKKKPTLLIDEAESLRGRDERTSMLREILNVGYKRGQKVIRCEGGNGKAYQPREFETFCPKVLILIGALPETLGDRCIPIQMKRHVQEKLERFRIARVKAETRPIQAAAKEWARRNRAQVERWYNTNDVTCLVDREAELWLPLFAVCFVAAPGRVAELEAIAQQLSGMKAASESADFGIRLLADIREFFEAHGDERVTTTDVLSALNGIQESPWPTWSNGRGLESRSLSRLLRSFGIQPKNLRLDETRVAKGYEKIDFVDAWKRYLGPVSATTATDHISQQDSLRAVFATQSLRSEQQSEENFNVYAGCSAVADEMVPSLADIADEVD